MSVHECRQQAGSTGYGYGTPVRPRTRVGLLQGADVEARFVRRDHLQATSKKGSAVVEPSPLILGPATCFSQLVEEGSV